MKKVLVITYYWPPSGGPGVQRWLKLCKYLPEFGVEPVVLTVAADSATYPILDPSLEKEIPANLRVIRTKSFEILNVYKQLKKDKQVPFSGFANAHTKVSLKEKAMRFIRGNFFIPDARIGWNKYALQEAQRLIQHEGITEVITTGPPHSTHLIGLKLKEKFPTLHWIADFRDPWSDIYYNDLLFRTRAAERKDRKMEKTVLEKADKVLAVSKSLKTLLLSKTLLKPESDIHVIPNGFDPADFAHINKSTQVGQFTLTYLGTATSDYPFGTLLEVLRTFEEHQRKMLHLQLIGSFDQTIHDQLMRYTPYFKVSFTPYVPHSQVPEILMQSDLLLVVIPNKPNNELILTGKVFEYLAAKKPILGLGPTEGDSARLLSETQSGKMFHYDDAQGIQSFLMPFLNHTAEPFNGYPENYSRKKQAEQVASLIIHKN
jgi:glycosyltransferase involved in cell wall biosynthesis